jgi:hypothetical protein
MKEKATFDINFWKSFSWFLIVVIIVCILPWLLAKHAWIDFSSTGEIGDTIGGIMGPFVAIAAAGLTFIAFWVQYKANIQQRHDIAIERFESNLFEMIHIQQEIINGLVIEYRNQNNNKEKKIGRDVFQYTYEEMPIRIYVGDGTASYKLKDALEIDGEVKMRLDLTKGLWFLDHYYRHLYRIFKYIDDANPLIIGWEKKYEYAAIVRATLSPYELIMLYYNGFSHPRFKELIERYALLNNVRHTWLASFEDSQMIKKKFQEGYSPSKDENRDMSREYKKGAFVYTV